VRDESRATNKQALADHPAYFTGGALAGGAPFAAAAAPLVAGLSPVAQGAILGGGLGAAEGAGMADGDLEDRLSGAAQGGVLGAATGGVGGKIAQKVSPILSRIKANLRGLRGPRGAMARRGAGEALDIPQGSFPPIEGTGGGRSTMGMSVGEARALNAPQASAREVAARTPLAGAKKQLAPKSPRSKPPFMSDDQAAYYAEKKLNRPGARRPGRTTPSANAPAKVPDNLSQMVEQARGIGMDEETIARRLLEEGITPDQVTRALQGG